MDTDISSIGPSSEVLRISTALNRAETVDDAVSHTIDLAEVVFEQPTVAVYEYGPPGDTVAAIQSSPADSGRPDRVPDELRRSAEHRLTDQGHDDETAATPPTVVTDPQPPLQADVLVPVGPDYLLALGTTDQDGFDDAAVATIERLAANLETALASVNCNRSQAADRRGDFQRTESQTEADAAALRRLNELTADSEGFDETVGQLLSLGCDHFGLDTGILSHVDGDDYEVDAVVDSTGTHEAGAVYELGDTMCDATLARDATAPLAFADVTDTEHESHPAAESVRAYIAAPVVVNGDVYGTVNFSMGEPRSAAFRPADETFVTLIAQWLGTAIQRHRRIEELERYETILEAVDDPVYALDAEGRFTFVNTAAEREFGYGAEVIGKRPSIGMDESDIERIREQIAELIAGDERSTRAEFELNTADGDRKVVENRLALIGDDEFRGTAGVLRDTTARNERQRQLESFQRAIESARDGVAILDGGEYTYIDQSHVEMYGFEDKAQLLGDGWRRLYDDEEVERLEAEAFPALESEGYWRGMVTGSRPDGSTFPAELSLTIVDDGRLVCTVRDETERRERERELELKERAMDEANVSIQITDPTQADNPLVYVNDGFERMTGYTRDEAIGRNPRFLQDEATDSEKRAQLREAVRAEESVSLELRNERKDGTPYWTRISLTPVTDESGTVSNYIGIQQDVTERKEREIQTEARKELLRRIYEVTTDPKRDFEEKITALLAAGRDHLDLPYGFLTRIEASDQDSGVQTIVEALGSHELLQPGESAPLERSYCRKTVEQDDLVTHTHAAEEGWADDPAYETFGLETYIGSEVIAGGDLYGTMCFASKEPRDDSFGEFERSFIRLVGRWVGYEIDRQDTREELREQRERLELALSGTNTGLAEWDLKTDAVTWNETLVDIVGRDIDTVEAFRAAVHPEDRDRVQRELETMIETGDPWVGEFRMRDATGDTLWLGTRATAVYTDDGEPVRVLATGTDISDKIEQEVSLRASEQRYRSLAENIPNGGVLTFDEDLEYRLAAGELLSELGVEASNVSGKAAGTLLPHSDIGDELVPRLQAALDGERTDRRVTLGNRTIRIHIAPVDTDSGRSDETRGLVLAQDVTEEARREQELFEERERFRLLTESVDEYAFVVVDEAGVIRTWNNGAERTFGYDAETATGMPMAELHPEADRESGLPDRLLQQAQFAGESAHEGWRVRADGSKFYADVRYAPLESDDGEFRGYATVVHDMTDRRRERRRTELFVKESDDVVTIVDPDGTVTYASGSADRVLGYEPDDLVGENLFDYLHPDGREGAMQTFYTCVEDADGVKTECRLDAPDGGWLNVEGRCRNMLDEDAIDGILVYLRDVTESKKRERRFESIFNQTFQFTGLLDPDGTVVEVNDAALEFGGIERDVIVGGRFSDAPWWTHSEAVRSNVRDAIDQAASGEFVRYETEVRGADGLATIDFSVKPVTDDSGDVSLLVVEGRDITAQKQQREHMDVMQRVMRHNMRNDLTKIRGWTEIMAEEPDPEKRAEQFETVERVLDRWDEMTEQIKRMRQIIQSTGNRQDTSEVRSLLETAVASVREADVDSTITVDAAGSPSVQLPTMLTDAVRELVENAVNATEAGTTEVGLDRPAEGWVEISVRDDGPGMSEMEVNVLETGEETPLSHGDGIDLWMVRTVVTQAGGEVSVESTADGTEVCLRLPTERTVKPAGV